ncbi:MAG: hypothetical protein KDJ88_21160 [Bauldia sp.]|nr:hypothetical protein [Bauldia sp.]
MTIAASPGAYAANAGSTWKTPEALVSTPAGVRAAGDYWTFDRMDRAVPRLPDVLDPVTLEPITMDKADPTRSYR